MKSLGLLILLLPVLASAEFPNVLARGDLPFARIAIEVQKKAHVAFMGGSITQMEGYRPMVMADLQKRFPDCAFTFTGAGLSSTCSSSGAFRLEDHVLKHGPVDLFYVEFAVNDDQDAGHSKEAAIRGLEGIYRHLKRHHPRSDMVLTYFANPHLIEQYRQGKVATSIAAHEVVSKHYGIPVINLAREAQQQIDAGTLTWKKYGGTHPHAPGNRLCADLHQALLDRAWKEKAVAKIDPGPLPAPIDPANYEYGYFVSPKSVKPGKGWTVEIPDWKSIKGGFRKDYANQPCLVSTTPGSETTIAFTGNAIGAFTLAGPDAGQVEARVDDGEWKTIELFHRYSKGLHYPRTVMFAEGLEHGAHSLRLRVSAGHHASSKGTAARFLHIAVNGKRQAP